MSASHRPTAEVKHDLSARDRARFLAAAMCVIPTVGMLSAPAGVHPAAPAGASAGWTVTTVAGGVGGPARASSMSMSNPCGVTWSATPARRAAGRSGRRHIGQLAAHAMGHLEDVEPLEAGGQSPQGGIGEQHDAARR
jgi:hypothetical protein